MDRATERIGICLAGDATYELGLRVALFSALKHLSVVCDVIILDGGLTRPDDLSRDANAHPRCASCRVLAPHSGVDLMSQLGERTAALPRGLLARYPIAGWMRVLLPELLPERCRVIYLDADLLVRADLRELWEEADADRPVSAVRDFYLGNFARGLFWARSQEWFRPNLPYFNSGVLVLNLDRLRQRGFVQELIEYMVRDGENLRLADQDAINAVLAGAIHELDPRWNVQEAVMGRDMFYTSAAGRTVPDAALRSGARIVHFTGEKPWTPEGIRLNFWSVALHIEYLRFVWRYGGRAHARLVRSALNWLAGFAVRRVPRAVMKRMPGGRQPWI